MKQDKKEELQSRRQFFRKAAKTALPILGAIALANVPIIGKAANNATGCDYGSCSGYCYGACWSVCSESCSGSCKGACDGSCRYGCYSSSN